MLPKIAESDIHMKQVSSTTFGYSWRQKVVSVFLFGRPQTQFFAPRNGHFQLFWVPKIGSSDTRIKKRTPLFVVNYT